MIMVKLIDIFFNTFKEGLTRASYCQGILFSTGTNFWVWASPYYFIDSPLFLVSTLMVFSASNNYSKTKIQLSQAMVF